MITEPNLSGSSEYEIYFNYMLKYNPTQIKIRKLNSKNLNNINDLQTNNNLDYISCHWFERI